VALLDPELTVSQPRSVSAVTGGRFAGARAGVVRHGEAVAPVTDVRPAGRWRFLEPNLEHVLTEPEDLPARSAMQLGAHFAGVAIENSMLGCCHACANPLTAHYGVTHGIAVGVMLPHVLRFNAPAAGGLYARLGDRRGSAAGGGGGGGRWPGGGDGAADGGGPADSADRMRREPEHFAALGRGGGRPVDGPL